MHLTLYTRVPLLPNRAAHLLPRGKYPVIITTEPHRQACLADLADPPRESKTCSFFCRRIVILFYAPALYLVQAYLF